MEQSLQFVVGDVEAGQRLDEFLAARIVRLSRMGIANMLARGGCAVNGAAASAGLRLSAGDTVEAAVCDETPNAMTPEPSPLDVVYEDEHLIVVVKPAGTLVHPTRGVKRGTLANALAFRMRIAESEADGETGRRGDGETFDDAASVSQSPALPVSPSGKSAVRNPQSFVRPGIVHRLDRDTSGLLVVAKTQSALSRLSQHFHRRLVEKRYLAVVCGSVERDAQTIAAPIGRDEEARPRWRVLEGGKAAETRLRVLERSGARTLVELEPVTGRTNQLRIHCAHAGHPVVGDRLYGGDAHARLCLHASRLAFRHPATNEPLEFSSRLPPEVASALGAG